MANMTLSAVLTADGSQFVGELKLSSREGRDALERLQREGGTSLKRLERASIDANDRGLRALRAGIGDVETQARILTQRLGPLGATLGALGPAGIAGAAAIGGIAFAMREVIEVSARFETLRAQLKTVTGSAELAAIEFDRILDFAAKTPFEVENLIVAFNRLAAAGIEPTNERLTAFGDLAASFGRDITEVADAVVAVMTGEAERLKQFGIIARFEHDKVRLLFRGTTREIDRDAASIVAALEEIARTQFAGGMAEQADTAAGALSNLSDIMSQLADQAGRETGLLDAYTAAIRGLTGALEGVREGLFPRPEERLEQIEERLKALRGAEGFPFRTPLGRVFGPLLERLPGVDELSQSAKDDQIAALENERLFLIRQLQDRARTQLVAARRAEEAAFRKDQEAAAIGEQEAATKRLEDAEKRLQDIAKETFKLQVAKVKARADAVAKARDEEAALEAILVDAERQAELAGLSNEEQELRLALLKAEQAIGRELSDQERERLTTAVQARQAEERAKQQAELAAREAIALNDGYHSRFQRQHELIARQSALVEQLRDTIEGQGAALERLQAAQAGAPLTTH